jgi:hypothetical protein
MAIHRSANGKAVDMAKLRAQNQHVRAVGNMNVDAAGNTLDSNNQVIDDSTNRVNRVYGRTTQNVGAATRRTQQPTPKPTMSNSSIVEENPPQPQRHRPAPQAVTPPPEPQPAPQPQPEIERNPLIRYPDEDDEDDIVDLEDYDTEEPVGKETPKKK